MEKQTMKWSKGKVGYNLHGGYKREFVDGYVIDDVFGVSRSCRAGQWRGTHLPTGMFVCDARTLANCKEIVEAFLQTAPAEWWQAITAERVENPTGEYTRVLTECARLRRELKK